MNFDTALRQQIITNQTVYGLIGNSCHAADAVPDQKELSYITFKRIGGAFDYDGQGADGIVHELWQIDIFAKTRNNTREIEQALRKALSFVSCKTFGDYLVFSSVCENTIDESEDDHKGNRIFKTVLEYEITRTEET